MNNYSFSIISEYLKIALILFCVSSLIFINLKAQSAEWVSTQLPGDLPLFYQYDVGETCIIFADDTSQSVYAFDIFYGDWQVLLVPTQLNWNDAMADGNAAMVWNDELVVGYSALTNTFSTLNYTGSLVSLSGVEVGCIDNFAFFVTDQLFYVFDAEDATWRSFSYTPPGAAPWGGGVRGKRDYIYLDLWINNAYPHTIAAYSMHTKTFAESTEENVGSFNDLDHGFTFIRTSTTPYLIGGYSAYTGGFAYKSSAEIITGVGPSVYEEHVSPLILTAAIMHEPISAEWFRRYFWVYNTREISFAEYWYLCDYAQTNAIPRGALCGGQHAIDLVENVGYQNQIECILYDSDTHNFSNFFTSLYQWGFNSYSCGGNVFDGFDEDNFYMYDVVTGSTHTEPVFWTQGFQPHVLERPLGNYWNVFAYREQMDDTIHVFSYNRTYNNFHTFDVRSDQSVVGTGGSDFFRIRVQDSINEDVMLLFSPDHDTWIIKDMTSTSYWGGEGNYCYINYTNLNETYFYDGQNNAAYNFPSAQVSQHVFARDSVFLMYSSNGSYFGYSIVKHNYAEYVTNRLTSQLWNNYIILNYNLTGSLYDHLLYDGYNNIFLPLTLTPTEGIRRNAWTGGKTAIVMSQYGYLFAYYPGEMTAVDDDNTNLSAGKFKLHQNYPNPFNPTTTIRYKLLRSSFVILKVYDLLGREVEKLVSGHRPAGEHQVNWNAKGLPSGIYFYRLQVGDPSTGSPKGQAGQRFIETKKFVLQR